VLGRIGAARVRAVPVGGDRPAREVGAVIVAVHVEHALQASGDAARPGFGGLRLRTHRLEPAHALAVERREAHSELTALRRLGAPGHFAFDDDLGVRLVKAQHQRRVDLRQEACTHVHAATAHVDRLRLEGRLGQALVTDVDHALERHAPYP
jgi:hypothetical protein